MSNSQEKYPNLRSCHSISRENWSLENLKDGLQYFFDKNNRYPSVKEVDTFEYLPTGRTIQRTFGGIVELRRVLGLNTSLNFSSGEMRSNTARVADTRARQYEERFYFELISKIPEVRVHEHKIIRPGDTAADFFVYTSDNDGIVIDLFYAVDMHSLAGVVNIKMKKYLNVKQNVYFVLVGNDDISQRQIDEKIYNRKNKLPEHIKVLTEKNFVKSLAILIK